MRTGADGLAPGLRTSLEAAYAEFAESDIALTAQRSAIEERQAALAARTALLQQRKIQLLAEIAERERTTMSGPQADTAATAAVAITESAQETITESAQET